MPLTQGSSPTQKGSAFTFQQVHTFEMMFFAEVVLKSEVFNSYKSRADSDYDTNRKGFALSLL